MAMSRRSAAALTTFGVFTLIALAFASSNYASYTIQNEPVNAWDPIGYAATEWYLWALMCPLIFLVARRFPLTGATWPRHLPMYFLTWLGCHLVVVSAYIVMERQWGTAFMQGMPLNRMMLLYLTKKIAFNLLVFTAAVATAAIGPGRFSLDNLYGWADNLSGLWWGVGVVGVAVLVSTLTLTFARRGSTGSGLPEASADEGVRRAA